MTPLIVDLEAVAIDRAGDFLEPIEAPSNYKNEDAKAKYIAEATARAVDRCALDPDLCRIVALGHCDDAGDRVTLIKNEAGEADELSDFWKRVMVNGQVRRLVTFHGFGYDLPVLMRRSQYLGVAHPILSLDRYRSEHIDLLQKLTWNGAIKAHSLKFYASRFGMPVEDDVQGSRIAELVRNGDWAGVESHCRSDLKLTRFIAQKLRLIPSTEPVAA